MFQENIKSFYAQIHLSIFIILMSKWRCFFFEFYVSICGFYLDLNRRFKTSPMDKDVSLLGSVELRCVPPGGNPPPTVKWKKSSIDIQSNERLKTEVDQSVYYLRINKVLQEDAGNYSCVASNEAEERVSRSAFLKVLGLFCYCGFTLSTS